MASPFPDRNTRVVTVGATGAYGQAQIAGMRAAGTQIVANVAIGRAGQATDGIPAFELGRRRDRRDRRRSRRHLHAARRHP